MKYLCLLFVFLLVFTVLVSFTVLAEGDIGNILPGNSDSSSPADSVQAFKNYLVKDESETSEISETSETPETAAAKNADDEKQIFIKVLDSKSGAVSTVDLEEYLCGVVFSEMPSSFEIEALKAQAVTARSFCVYRMLYSTQEIRDFHKGADICNDPKHCEDYISYGEACDKYGEDYVKPLWDKVKNAVDATKGEIITYQSEPAVAVFHAMSGKETESAENVWGSPIPYLISVPSEEDSRQSEIKNYITQSKFTPDEFKSDLTSNGFAADFSESPESWTSNIALDSSGRVASAEICGEAITGIRLREIFALRSTDFTLEYDGENEEFVFTVAGYGHGVGMSQYGANLMAEDGKNYIDILLWYYTGVEITPDYKFF
ncbi:MAG: stage II sporulation protein D [Oscillospiraceae bacterium]|nr:stage II sporulation protein D [Oscillospiraceae bacterium]